MSSGRRLCMVVHGPYPIGEPRVTREAAAAILEGWEVDVLACMRPGEARRELIDGVNVFRLPVMHRRGAGLVATAWEYLGFATLAAIRLLRAHARRRYDVIQIHNPPDFLVCAALLPRLAGAKIVFDVHDLSPDMFAMRFGEGRLLRIVDHVLRMIERLACGVADLVVTVHEPYRRALVERGVSEDKIHVVMNTVDERVLPTIGVHRSSGARIVYHGTLTRHYGVELLCEAFAAIAETVPDASLEIYGEGDALNDIRRRVGELGLDGRVVLRGSYMRHEDVLEAVAGAAIGVIPNLPTRLNRFALSSKLFEYVALGIPVVSADLETISAHFSEQEIRFFHAGDAADLASALRDGLVHRDESRARAQRARLRYERDYRWPIQARRYLDLLASVAEVSPQTRDDDSRMRDATVPIVD